MSSRQVTNRDNKNLVNAIAVDQQAKEDRLNQLSTIEYNKIRFVHLSQYIINNVSISNAAIYTSVDVRAISGVGPTVKAFFGNLWLSGSGSSGNNVIIFGSSDDTLNSYSEQYKWVSAAEVGNGKDVTQMVLIPLGSDGKFIMTGTTNNAMEMSLTLFATLE